MRHWYFSFAEKVQIYLVVLACFSIALPTAFMSISMGLFVIAWALSGDYKNKFQLIFNHPAALISIAFFLLYGIGMLYSSASWEMRMTWWLKYHKLLYVPLIITVLADEKYRSLALKAFLAGMLMVLFISYLKWMGVVPHKDIGQGYFVFKGRIAHNIFMAFTMYLTLHLAVKSFGLKRWVWSAVSFLSAMNILFLVNGRSGQIIMVALIFWFLWETWRWKSVRWLSVLVVSLPVIYFIADDLPKNRLMEIKQEVMNHDPSQAPTSSGLRLEFYQNALTLISQNPIFGGGTGSFENEYRALAENQKTVTTYVPNPHNEFLLTGQELGVVGLLILIAYFIIFWRMSYRLDVLKINEEYYGYALRGLVVTIVVGSLFNSLLLDAGEGKFFCVLAGVFLSVYQPKKNLINKIEVH
ncbi:O-antigen ligase family protein [Rhodoferax sp. U2-2l]|uniref:O-antigen ligase family protein n=1 Tax=Rhodoferax sp. U2-2l TaxID=2884000 RepID=UPI001D0AA9C5|nr:O-antigen ligase family protein [Rhodoferax sp. U2-2l]MCB8747655.1 O-antigen ligase family protein [Rhodoferax sp. U2-2l]